MECAVDGSRATPALLFRHCPNIHAPVRHESNHSSLTGDTRVSPDERLYFSVCAKARACLLRSCGVHLSRGDRCVLLRQRSTALWPCDGLLRTGHALMAKRREWPEASV